MGRVIGFRDSEHEKVQRLLPWHAMGVLEPDDLALVEAHLSGCAECQADLALERRLGDAFAEVTPEEAEAWTPVGPASKARPRRRALAELSRAWRSAGPWLGWALAGPAMAAAALVSVFAARAPMAQFHTLSAKATPTGGDIVVIFRPDAREKDLRAALRASHARLVDGPTSADAYVLSVAVADRPTALATLKRQPAIELAEPIDSNGPP